MARPISIRQLLLRILLVLIGLLGAGAMATTFLGAGRLIDSLANATMSRTIESTRARLDGFFGPVQAELEVLRDLGEGGLLPLDDPERLTRLLVALLRNHEQTTGLILANEDGREHMITRTEETWGERRIFPPGGEALWREWTDEEPTPRERREPTDYDPRERPWFRLAEARPGQISWTAPYLFFLSQRPGLTVSVRFEDPEGVAHVVGYDVRLREVSEFTETLRPTANGVAFVVTRDGRLVGLPAIDRFASAAERRAALLQFPDELGIPLFTDMVTAWLAAGERIGTPIEITSDGKSWWGEARAYDLAGEGRFRVGVLVPKADLVGDVAAVRWTLAGLTLVVLLLAALRAIAVARRLSEPIEDLARRSDRIGQGELDPQEPLESRILEVQNLAEAQEQMRGALRSLVRVERDLELAREIQERSLPEVLPDVPGYEFAGWTEPAEQAGGDSFDVIAYRRDPAGGPNLLTSEGADRGFCMVADAAGHGVGPALSVTQVHSMLRMGLRSGAELAWLVRHLSEQLAEDLPPGRFVTVWFGDLDASAHTLTGFSAGQAPLLLYRAAELSITTLEADAPPLGILAPDEVTVPEPILLERGDLFAVLSDGVFEMTNPADEAFGDERVFDILRREAPRGARAVLAALREALAQFADGTPSRDDCTILLIQRSP
ncbi:MAG: SpoIIE family protein phosphatase [Kiloniellales bacterium]|nr:SpoIIE family protein phosphatase [Myxococcota bacterium]MDJ0980861.1 SpoIIE family protein phosphatase [Kiloniellales bacterium]